MTTLYFKRIPDPGMVPFTGILTDLGKTYIPESTDNRHWLDYLDWLAAGNSPDSLTMQEIPTPP